MSLMWSNRDLRGQIDLLQVAIAYASHVTTIHLPIRRSLTTELNAVTFVCRQGRVYPLDYTELSKAFQDGTKLGSAAFKSDTSTVQRARELISYFDRSNIGNGFFRLKLQGVVEDGKFSGFVILTVPRKRDQGESLSVALAPNSEFAKTVKQTDPTKHYVRFLVWSDSFELYLSVRAG